MRRANRFARDGELRDFAEVLNAGDFHARLDQLERARRAESEKEIQRVPRAVRVGFAPEKGFNSRREFRQSLAAETRVEFSEAFNGVSANEAFEVVEFLED